MFKQPTFGGGGLGGGGSNLFGQSSNTAFGTPPAFNAQTPFNSSTTGGLGGSTFAASSALKFPTSTTSGGGLFGNSGLGNQTSGFQTSQGGGLFGSGTTTGGGLFQTSQAGQANRSLFGGNNPTNVFGTPSSGTGTGSLFGPQQQSSFSTSSFGGGGLFRGGMGTGGGGSVFGGATTQGTPVKYQPTSGTDSLQRNGYTSTISTRLQVITGMKDYEAKSLDELRFEDYMQGRKGPQQASALGGGLFANQQKTGLFGQQNQQTSLAGTAFGQKPGGLFGQAQLGGSGGGGGLFGQQSKPGGLFGQNSSIGSQAGGLFGQQTSSSGLQLGQSTGFGAQQQTGVFGNKPGGLGGGFGGFQVGGSNTASTLFNQQSAGTGGLQLGGGSTGPGFGTGTGLNFGGVPTGGAFGVNKPGGLSLGTGGLGGTQTGGFSLGGGLGGGLGDGGLKLGQSFGTGGLQLGNTGTLGQTTGLGSQQHTGLGLGLGLGQTGLGLGGTSTLGGTQFAVVPQQELLKLQLQALKNSPFGDSPLFRNAVKEAKDSEPVKSTSGHAITRSTTTPSHYKVMPKPASKIKPRRITGKRDRDSKSQLFEDDEDESRLLSPVQPKRNIKTLVIKPKQSPEKLVIRTNSETNRESVVDTAVSTMPSDSSLAALITPQRPLTATVPFHSPETKAKGENPDDSQHIPSGTPNGVVGDTVNKTKSPGLVISENYTNPVIQPNPIRNRSLDDTVSELHGRKPAPDSESHDLSSYSTDGSVLSPSNTSHVQGSPVVSGATPDEVTGIMLLKPGYDTVPSMEELRHMARSQPAGELVVDDFTIQREGFGKVQFFGKTNVFGLNLDETVHIRRKEICVYPDEDLKPPQGEGLNKRARVTLTGTWPIDKSTREPIMDPERLQTMRYSEKVERSTLKMGATFIDYLPETGSWIFEVRHFSKYGLVDDDDSDDDSGDTVPKKIQNNQPQQQPRQQQAQQQPKQSTGQQVPLQKQPSHFTDNDTEMAEIPDDDSQRQPQQDANDSASVSSQSEVAIGLGGVNSRQVQVMKASFFGESVDENEKPQRVARLTPANAARHSMFGHR
jgi:nuclear pore complex protein Nup98-Nup96